MNEHTFDEVAGLPTFEPVAADRGRVSIPPGLDDMEPGPVLAAFLSIIDPDGLSGHDRVVLLRAHQRMVSHYEAKLLRDVSSVSDTYLEEMEYDHETANEAAAMELRAGLWLTRRSAESKLDLADLVHRRLPVVGAAMTSGRIDVARARVIAHGSSHLTEDEARLVAERVIDAAPARTTGQLAADIRRLCVEVQPEQAVDRYQTAVDQRRLVTEPTVDGTAHLTILDASPDRAGEAYARINHIARSLHHPGETRSIDQLRADVALDLLCGRDHHKTVGRGTVNIHVDLDTLTRLAETPGDLAGYGPVVADIARQVTAAQTSTEWRYKVADPATGMPVHIGTTTRRPNAEQQRYVELRDQTCVFPGCRLPATQCDLDHIDPWERAHRTTVLSLAPVCRHDHVRRHRHGWTYAPLPGADYLWTSPLGHKYTTSGRSPPKTT